LVIVVVRCGVGIGSSNDGNAIGGITSLEKKQHYQT